MAGASSYILLGPSQAVSVAAELKWGEGERRGTTVGLEAIVGRFWKLKNGNAFVGPCGVCGFNFEPIRPSEGRLGALSSPGAVSDAPFCRRKVQVPRIAKPCGEMLSALSPNTTLSSTAAPHG